MGENKQELTPASRLRWDVFVTFRDVDTRERLIRPLEAELALRGVRAVIDKEGSAQGDDLLHKLPDAIEDTALSVAIISPRYASSRWCLEDLAKICECGRLILPVFYHVSPSNVRRQKGPLEEDFEKLERFGHEQLERWRGAMQKVGGISGWDFPENRYLIFFFFYNSRLDFC